MTLIISPIFWAAAGVATNDMDYFAMVYQFAMNKLKDHDGVFNIRRYFKEVLWPEKNQSR